MQLNLTPLADAGVEVLPPDILWDGIRGDFALAAVPQDGASGGLVAANPLKSSVAMLLFTDGSAESYEINEAHGGDLRGWPGDGFDIDTGNGEAPLGSKLWLYRRAVLNEQTGFAIEAEAKRALQPLIAQGAVVRIETKSEADYENDRLFLTVSLYGRSGAEVYADKFDMLWRRADGRL